VLSIDALPTANLERCIVSIRQLIVVCLAPKITELLVFDTVALY